MFNRFTGFIVNMLIGVAVGAFTFGFSAIFGTSMLVTCELDADQTYNCTASDTIFGYGFIKVQADQVINLEQHTHCGGTGKNHGCSYESDFITTSGEKIQLSHMFTTDKPKVTEMVDQINALMSSKSTPIIYDTGTSSRLYYAAAFSLFMFGTFATSAFFNLFSKRNRKSFAVNIGART